MDWYWVDGIELISKAVEKREETKAWGMWLALFPRMTKDNFIPFSQFFKKQTQIITQKSSQEILDEVAEIERRFKERGG